MLSFFITLTALLGLVSTLSVDDPVVETSSGPIRGHWLPYFDVYEFIGIPFAQPPVGDLRFRKPAPVLSWNETFNATLTPNACFQSSDFTATGSQGLPGAENNGFSSDTQIEMSEDCLYLNLWVPAQTLDFLDLKTAPFTFIHGGEFRSGFASAFNGSVLASFNEIVVATIQYRLGSLGFMTDGTEDAPGNLGLWDQLEAMKWLCENFAVFGADCEKHTIGGQGAGAVSVGFHVLSPYSKPYFQRAIMQSGSALAPNMLSTALQIQHAINNMTFVIGNGRCSRSANKTDCLRSLPSWSFPIADSVLPYLGRFAFTPVIDGDFIPQNPMTTLTSGEFDNVPMIIGANTEEGTSVLLKIPKFSDMATSFKGDLGYLKGNMTSDLFRDLIDSTFDKYSANNFQLLHEAVRTFYWPKQLKGLPKGSKWYDSFVEFLTDQMYACPVYRWAELVSSKGNSSDKIWVYNYSHQAQHGFMPEWMGVTHNAELPMVFGRPFLDSAQKFNYSFDDKVFSMALMELWSNFVKHGDPNLSTYGSFFGGMFHFEKWQPFLTEACNGNVVDLKIADEIKQRPCASKTKNCSFWYDFYYKLVAVLLEKSQKNEEKL